MRAVRFLAFFCLFFAGSSNVFAENSNIYTKTGNIYAENEKIYTESSNIYTKNGYFITDDTGTTITLHKPAQRIVPLYGAFIDVFEELDAVHLLVGRTAADEKTESVRHLPSVGTHMRPNLELIVGLRPDLVLQMAGRDEALEHVQVLRRLGIQVAVFEVDSFAALFATMERIGVLTGKQTQSKVLITALQQRLDRVTERIVQKLGVEYIKPTVFFEIRENLLLAAGQSSIVSAIIEQAGGVNCVAGKGRVVRFTEEMLYVLNPAVYVYQQGIMNPTPNAPYERSAYAALQAVQQKRVLLVEQGLFSRPSSRSVEAVELLASFLFPDVFEKKNKE